MILALHTCSEKSLDSTQLAAGLVILVPWWGQKEGWIQLGIPTRAAVRVLSSLVVLGLSDFSTWRPCPPLKGEAWNICYPILGQPTGKGGSVKALVVILNPL